MHLLILRKLCPFSRKLRLYQLTLVVYLCIMLSKRLRKRYRKRFPRRLDDEYSGRSGKSGGFGQHSITGLFLPWNP